MIYCNTEAVYTVLGCTAHTSRQERHSLRLANADHPTLLLNSYTKLEDVANLKHSSRPNPDGNPAVTMRTGYFQHASCWAKYERHEEYLRQIEDVRDFKDVLMYLRTLGKPLAVFSCPDWASTMLMSVFRYAGRETWHSMGVPC